MEGRVVLHDDDQAMALLPGSLPAPHCVAYTGISTGQGTKVTPIPIPTTSQLSLFLTLYTVHNIYASYTIHVLGVGFHMASQMSFIISYPSSYPFQLYPI